MYIVYCLLEVTEAASFESHYDRLIAHITNSELDEIDRRSSERRTVFVFEHRAALNIKSGNTL